MTDSIEIPVSPGLSSELLMFRNAYLQSIASCWTHPKKKAKFLSPVTKVATKNPSVNIDFHNVFETGNIFRKKLDKPLDWRVDAYVIDYSKVQRIDGNYTAKYYAPYNPNSINGWVGYADVMVVKIPNSPEYESEYVEALAHYYDLFTTFFGNPFARFDCKSVSSVNGLKKIVRDLGIVNDKLSVETINDIVLNDALLANPTSNLGDGIESQFQNFGAVFLSIIAACWKDPNYCQYLTQRPLAPLSMPGSVLYDQYVHFKNTWNFTIVFQKAELKNSIWKVNGPKDKYWDRVENNVLLLNYPVPPEAPIECENPSLRALAFSQYNNTGPEYPLTCPC